MREFGTEQQDDVSDEASVEEKWGKWLALIGGHPPEWLASYVESPQASCMVVTGHGAGMEQRTACLDRLEDIPYWALALAKAYLDDVGEWPLQGMHAEYALLDYELHRDPRRALTEIIAAIKPVWPDVEVIYAGDARN